MVATTIRRLIAPKHELFCPFPVWRRLLRTLRDRGRLASRESGAFLLGNVDAKVRRIVDFVPYDDLDPHCLQDNMIIFDGGSYGALWTLCRQRHLSVVADIHVHPGSVLQSSIDKVNPMVSTRGHLALILPRYAIPPVRRREIGIYRYEGDGMWTTVPVQRRRAFFHIGM